MSAKGYVVRWDDARGQALYAIRDSTSTVREDATVFATIREAVIEAGDGFATARIVAVAEDGTETPVPSYEEALAENERLRAEVDRWQKSEAGCVRAGLEKVGQLKAENDRLRSERDALSAAWARCAAAAVEDRDAQIAADMEQHGGEEWRARTQQEVEAAKGALRALGVDVDALLRIGT